MKPTAYSTYIYILYINGYMYVLCALGIATFTVNRKLADIYHGTFKSNPAKRMGTQHCAGIEPVQPFTIIANRVGNENCTVIF